MNRHTEIVALLLGGILGLGCGSLPTVTLGRRGEPTAWDPDLIAQVALELETVVARSARDPEQQIVDHVGTELEFGEEEVDPAALLGAMEDLSFDAPTLVDLHVDTVEVAAAIRARQLRARTLQDWKARGCLGENAQGKLVFVNCSAVKNDPPAGSRLAFMVIKENRDRRNVYESLLKNNNWPKARFHEVRATFATAIRELAPPGNLFPDGSGWAQKDADAAARAVAEAKAAQPEPRRRRTSRPEEWDEAETLDVDLDAVPPRAVTQR